MKKIVIILILLSINLFSQNLGKSLDTLVITNDTVSYKSNRITYDLLNKRIYFREKNQIFYKNNALFSDSISFETDSGVMYSTKNLFLVDVKTHDTIWIDSLRYNFKKNVGLMWNLSTKFENKYIIGSVVKKKGNDTYFAKYLFFTTELDSNPQTYFYTKLGRMDNSSRVAYGKPVIMNVDEVPVVALPIFIYPMAGKKRKSGFLRPTYGGGESSGRYIKNIGYYFVLNDYSDLKINSDFYEGKSISYGGTFRFNHWFWTAGPSNFTYHQYRNIDYFNDVNKIDNDFSVSHKNYLDYSKNFSLSLNGRYMSSENIQDSYTLENLNEQLTKNTNLNGGISGKIGDISLSSTFSRSADISRKIVNWVKPSLSIRGFPLIKYSTILPLIYGKKDWYYKSKNYDPTISKLDKFVISFGGVDFKNIENYDDSLHTEKKRYGYNLPLSASIQGLKLFHIDLVPSFNFSHVGMSHYSDSVWHDHYYSIVKYTDSLGNVGIKRVPIYRDSIRNSLGQMVVRDSFYVDTAIERFTTVNSYSASLSARTNLYGIFHTDILGVKGFRHTVSPSLSYSYSPGVDDYYHYNESVVGAIYRTKSKTVSASLGQGFDMKWQYSDTSQVHYLNLLRLSSSISYNFESENKKLSTLNSSLSIPLMPFFHSSFSVDFYDNSDKYSLDKANIQSYSYSFNFPISITGKIFSGDIEDWNKIDMATTRFSFSSGLNVSYNATRVASGIYSLRRSISTNLSSSIDLTRTTHLSYTASVNLANNEITNHTFTLEKSIRRWKMRLYWIPKGPAKRLDFRVYFIDFGDLKIEKSDIRY